MMETIIHCFIRVCSKGLLIHRKRSPFPDKGRLNILGFASLCSRMTRAGALRGVIRRMLIASITTVKAK